MIDGLPLVDVHLHPARRATLKVPWQQWVQGFPHTTEGIYTPAGDPDPVAFRRHLAEQGVDVALLMAEYSPRVTGIQAIEDLLGLVGDPSDTPRIGVIANINPHYHFPVEDEVRRQLALGAVALKVHPVHAGISANDPELFPAYEICRATGVPVVVHCGTSTFPGAKNRFGDPVHLDDVIRNFPGLHLVLAHGGRGWWYDAAAFLALANERVWIELSGLPPRRLPEYYAHSNWNRLVRKMIFGTDWPGIPGIAANARAVAALCPDEETRGLVLAGNAARVYRLDVPGLQR
jgi:predicted TIM-barrel fold metal-dependent hydrolase